MDFAEIAGFAFVEFVGFVRLVDFQERAAVLEELVG